MREDYKSHAFHYLGPESFEEREILNDDLSWDVCLTTFLLRLLYPPTIIFVILVLKGVSVLVPICILHGDARSRRSSNSGECFVDFRIEVIHFMCEVIAYHKWAYRFRVYILPSVGQNGIKVDSFAWNLTSTLTADTRFTQTSQPLRTNLWPLQSLALK